MKIMRTYLIAVIFITLVGCATRPSRGTEITFYREGAQTDPVTVTLRWNAAHDPNFYTPRGSMTEISISEFGRSVYAPIAEINRIEDIWPERVELLSPRAGDYDLLVPSGVGEGSNDTFRFRVFQTVRGTDALDQSQALQRNQTTKKQNKPEMATPRKPSD